MHRAARVPLPGFVARSTGQAFLRYLTNQRRGLTGERHATRTRELSKQHGYDTKDAMHALRIAAKPDVARVDEFLVRTYRAAWD